MVMTSKALGFTGDPVHGWGLGSNPGEDIDVCKCIVSLRHGGTLNSRRAASPFVRLVEAEDRWEAPDPHPQCSPSKLGWNRAKSYYHLYGAQGYGGVHLAMMYFVGLDLTQLRSEDMQLSKIKQGEQIKSKAQYLNRCDAVFGNIRGMPEHGRKQCQVNSGRSREMTGGENKEINRANITSPYSLLSTFRRITRIPIIAKDK
ncbi:hypothetical protein TNCV_2716821 [Trichonephila clavipes]|nr:hypothetical protein TNCV_2716821 [Trichonephila clavipes]